MPKFPYRFVADGPDNQPSAGRAFRFFRDFLVLDGRRPFELEPWQKFIVGSLFGWIDVNGYRRFNTAYIETGKGSGKTPLAAGVGLYGLVADQEPAAEVYACGVTRDQAAYLFQYAKKMAEDSPELLELFGDGIGEHNIAWRETRSYFRPLSSEGRSLDNKRPHMALIDEVHEHPSSVVVDKMRAGVKGRKQALNFEITNAGYDRNTVCWQHHEYSLKVLNQAAVNERWFAYICQLDEGDKWDEEGLHWLKANPNLDVSLPWDYLREQVNEAKGMPSKQNIVRRLNFCEWTEASTRWLDPDQWAACGDKGVDEDALMGRPCYAGLDLSATQDITACVLVFPGGDGTYDVVPRFWLPRDGAEKRAKRDGVEYVQWIEAGYIKPTPGNVTDYDVVRRDIQELAERFDIQEIAYDRWNATQLIVQLGDDGALCIPVGQGYASMSGPSKELERLIAGRMIRHGSHPVLTWMARNVTVEMDPAGNIKPSKYKSTERIDGIVALVMAIERTMRHLEDDGDSVYDHEGIYVL